jgi:hypothetical protein
MTSPQPPPPPPGSMLRLCTARIYKQDMHLGNDFSAAHEVRQLASHLEDGLARGAEIVALVFCERSIYPSPTMQAANIANFRERHLEHRHILCGGARGGR